MADLLSQQEQPSEDTETVPYDDSWEQGDQCETAHIPEFDRD